MAENPPFGHGRRRGSDVILLPAMRTHAIQRDEACAGPRAGTVEAATSMCVLCPTIASPPGTTFPPGAGTAGIEVSRTRVMPRAVPVPIRAGAGLVFVPSFHKGKEMRIC